LIIIIRPLGRSIYSPPRIDTITCSGCSGTGNGADVLKGLGEALSRWLFLPIGPERPIFERSPIYPCIGTNWRANVFCRLFQGRE